MSIETAHNWTLVRLDTTLLSHQKPAIPPYLSPLCRREHHVFTTFIMWHVDIYYNDDLQCNCHTGHFVIRFIHKLNLKVIYFIRDQRWTVVCPLNALYVEQIPCLIFGFRNHYMNWFEYTCFHTI